MLLPSLAAVFGAGESGDVSNTWISRPYLSLIAPSLAWCHKIQWKRKHQGIAAYQASSSASLELVS